MAGENETSTVMEDARAAMEEIGAPPDVPIGIEPPEPKPIEGETAEAKEARTRDEQGRFAKGKTLTTADPKVAAKVTAEVADQGFVKTPEEKAAEVASDAAKVAAGAILPPSEWKGAAKVKWDKLPQPVQAELRDMYASVAADKAEVAPFRELLDSHKQLLINEAGSQQAGLTALFSLARMSVDNPVGLIDHIARSRGIDLRALVNGQPAPGTQSQQPDARSTIAQLVQQELQPIRAQFEQRETQQTLQKIAAFRDDPKHPYFNDVVDHMVGLIESAKTRGQPLELQDAYDQATWANPAIRTQLLAQQAEETKTATAAQVGTARRAAAASLTGSPIPGATAAGQSNPKATARDDALNAYRELNGLN